MSTKQNKISQKEFIRKMQYKYKVLQDIIWENGKTKSFPEEDNFSSKMVHIMKVSIQGVMLMEKEGIFFIMVASMKEESKKMTLMDMGHIVTLFKDTTMKENGSEIVLQEKENKNFRMAHIMKVNFLME